MHTSFACRILYTCTGALQYVFACVPWGCASLRNVSHTEHSQRVDHLPNICYLVTTDWEPAAKQFYITHLALSPYIKELFKFLHSSNKWVLSYAVLYINEFDLCLYSHRTHWYVLMVFDRWQLWIGHLYWPAFFYYERAGERMEIRIGWTYQNW